MTDTLASPASTRRRPHTRYIVAAVVCVAIAGWMLTVLQKNVVYLQPVSITVAAAASLLGIVVLAVGLQQRGEELLRHGRRFVPVVLAGALTAFGAMEWALFSHDFSIKYVADNVARATPGLYTFTALWGAL